MLFEYLKEHYDDGEPIFLDDIHIEGMRRDNFRQQIKTLADAGKIVRYEKGIYYIPIQLIRRPDSRNGSKVQIYLPWW